MTMTVRLKGGETGAIPVGSKRQNPDQDQNKAVFSSEQPRESPEQLNSERRSFLFSKEDSKRELLSHYETTGSCLEKVQLWVGLEMQFLTEKSEQENVVMSCDYCKDHIPLVLDEGDEVIQLQTLPCGKSSPALCCDCQVQV